MRTFGIISLAAIAGLLLQTTLPNALRVGSAVPDVLLVLCVYLGFHRHTAGGALGAFLLGYLEDNFSGTAAGLNAFGMTLAFLFVYLASRRLWMDNVVSRVVVVFVASLVKLAGVAVLMACFFSTDGLWGTFAGAGLIQSALAALVAPPIFAVLTRTQRMQEESSD